MKRNEKDIVIMIAEDDDDDYLLTQKALQDAQFAGSIRRVSDGEELMASLKESALRGSDGGRPMLLLLDLNMPRKDGREALGEIKAHPDLRKIPVVVLTTSRSESDISISYGLGANSFVSKPAGYEKFFESIKALKQYWLDVAELPRPGSTPCTS